MHNYKVKHQNVRRAILSLLIFLLVPIASHAEEGTQKWTIEFEWEIQSSPAIGSGGIIYIGADNNLYAINPNGTLKWASELTNPSFSSTYARSSPAIGSDGTIYVGSYCHNFYAINPDGTKKWSLDIGSLFNLLSPAISSDGTIYVGTDSISDNYLFAINSDGTKKWEYQVGDSIESSPAIGSDGTIYVGSKDNYLYAINPNGTLKWQFLTVGDVDSSPAIGSDGTIYVGSQDHKLYAINPNGTLKWQFATSGEVNSSPAIGSDGTIYVGSWNDTLYAINPNGTLKWQFKTLYVESSPAIGSDGTIYVASYDTLYAINSDGTKKWESTIYDGRPTSPAISSDSTVYVANWHTLYAINGSSGGLAHSSWPMFHHDARHSGNVQMFISPTVTTDPATSVTSNSASLNGKVNPNGSITTYYFEYGTDASYGLTTETVSAGSGTSVMSVNINIADLNPYETYHYRIRATNNFGTSYGTDRMFYTENKAMPWIPLLLLDD